MPEGIVITDTECEMAYRVGRGHGVEDGVPLELRDADLRTRTVDVFLGNSTAHGKARLGSVLDDCCTRLVFSKS
jgi:hypothetical protein